VRIVVLTHATVGWGGTEANTLGAVRALVVDGHDVTLIQLGHRVYDSVETTPDGYRLVHVPLPGRLRDLSLAWWYRLLRSYEPDICVLSKGGFDTRASALDVAARMYVGRYVLLEHHPAAPPPPRTSSRHLGGRIPGIGLWWWRNHIPARLHLRLAHRVITDSEHVTKLLCHHYGLRRSETFVVHPGIDPAIFALREDARVRFRNAWGIPSRALVLGSVGRLAKVKGLERSLRAMRGVCASLPDRPVRLVLAGQGPERDTLEREATALGISNNVVLPGYIDAAADALSAIDVYLMPSREEGFGIALLEAMACERVCVAMNSGGPGEILTDASLGWLTAADDEASFTRAVIEAVAMSDAERAAMGARARAHVEANFNGAEQMRHLARLIVGG